MGKNHKSNVAAAAIFNFGKSGFVSRCPRYGQCLSATKLRANSFIKDRYMAKNLKSNMTAAAILNFGKSGIWGHSIPDMVNIYQHTKLGAIIFINDPDMAKNPKSKMAAAAILNFRKSVIFLYKLHSYGKCRSAHEIWWKLAQKWLRYTCLCISKMAAVGHLGIILSFILDLP